MKRIVIITIIFSFFSSIWAKPINLEEAFKRIGGLKENITRSESIPASIGKYQLVAEKGASFILSNKDGGFLVLSSDDQLPPVLGFSETGTLREDNIPPAMVWWLEHITEGVENHNSTLFRSTRSEQDKDKEEIRPLLKTKWNQWGPYNLTCPKDMGRACATGCVATAMAQIMNYYQYPAQGKDTHSYAWNGETIDTDFSNYIFDWDSMLPEYKTGEYSDKEALAVAQLMEACGKSVMTNYGVGESGAYPENIQYALPHFFSYDSTMSLVERVDFTDDKWEDIIYNELIMQRPVLYYGTDVTGYSHIFICDGYSDGYFHFNWGWGGIDDGYFLITPMRLNQMEYVRNEAAYIGVSPNYTVDKTVNFSAYFSIDIVNVEDTEIRFIKPKIIYNNPYERDFEIMAGVKITSEYGKNEHTLKYPEFRSLGGLNTTGGLCQLLVDDIKIAINQVSENITEENILSIMLDDGKYIIEPIYSFDGEKWLSPYIKNDSQKYYSFTVTGDKIDNIEGEGYKMEIFTINDCSTMTTAFEDKPFTLRSAVLNDGDKTSLEKNIIKEILDSAGELRVTGKVINSCSILPGDELIDLEEFDGLPAGEYTVRYTFEFYNPVTYETIFNVQEKKIIIHRNEEVISYEGHKYIVTDDKSRSGNQKSVRMISDGETVFKGHLEIPSSIVVNGEECKVVEIDRGIIQDNRKLTGISIKAPLFNEVPDKYFSNLSIESIELPEGVTSIGAMAFENCHYLMDITLPSTLKKISVGAFMGCESIENIIVNAKEPPVLNYRVFSTTNYEYATIKVPEESIAAYREANVWKNFKCLNKEVDIPVTSIALDVDEVTLEEEETVKLTASILPLSATDKTVVWTSSHPEVAEVSGEGLVKAIKPGTVIVSASTNNGMTATCKVTVKAKVIEVVSIVLDQSELTLEEGEKVKITAMLTPDNATDKSVIWTTTDREIADISSEGVISALKPGNVTITALTPNGLTAYCNVTVTPKVIEVATISLDQSEIYLEEGNFYILTATVTPEDATDKTVTWSSSDETVATVSYFGAVTAVKEGTATITATTSNGLTATCTVTVIADSGVEEIATANAAIVLSDTQIVVSGLTAPIRFVILTANGSIVKSGVVDPFANTIEFDSKGIFIIRIGSITKIIIR